MTQSILQPQPGSVAIVGLGVLGSHLAPLLGRMPGVTSLTLIDCDFYDEKNLLAQAITREDVGEAKVLVQARRLSQINPHLPVNAILGRVEDVPAGDLHVQVAAGCLDSRQARRTLNRLTWRLGAHYVDAGVLADAALARVQVHRPGPEDSCLECQWDEEDYRLEAESFSCDGTPLDAPSTNASASLGALAAARQALEIERILRGDDGAMAGHEAVVDARHHREYLTRLPRRASCRCDHRRLTIHPFPGDPYRLTLADIFAHASGSLRVEGQVFATQWACADCQTLTQSFGLRNRLGPSMRCSTCRRAMRPVGFSMREQVSADDVPAELLAKPVSTLGFREGEIFSLTTSGGETHFALTTISDNPS